MVSVGVGGRRGGGGLAPSFLYDNLPCPHLGIRVSEDRHHANTITCVQMVKPMPGSGFPVV